MNAPDATAISFQVPTGTVVVNSGGVRDSLAPGLVLTKGQDRCIWVWPAAEFAAYAERLNEASRSDAKVQAYQRVLFSGASDEIPDKQGRVSLPQGLRDYANLDRDVTKTLIETIRAKFQHWQSHTTQAVLEHSEHVSGGNGQPEIAIVTPTASSRLGDLGHSQQLLKPEGLPFNPGVDFFEQQMQHSPGPLPHDGRFRIQPEIFMTRTGGGPRSQIDTIDAEQALAVVRAALGVGLDVRAPWARYHMFAGDNPDGVSHLVVAELGVLVHE